MNNAAALEPFYTPARVRALLVLYAYLADSEPPRSDDNNVTSRARITAGGWREEAMVKRADIARGLAWLQSRDWRIAYTVRAHLVVGLALEDIASYLQREGGGVHTPADLDGWVDYGVQQISWYLDGED